MDALKGAQHRARTAKSQQTEFHGSCPFYCYRVYFFLTSSPMGKAPCDSSHSDSSSAMGKHCQKGICHSIIYSFIYCYLNSHKGSRIIDNAAIDN